MSRSPDIPAMDWPDFGKRVRIAMAEDNLSIRQAADVIGVDQATLHRLAKHGKEPSASTYIFVERWLTSRGQQP